MAAMVLRVECPTCQTSYTAERVGIPNLGKQETAALDVACVLCKTVFSVTVSPKTIVTEPGWWARTVLRRKPTEVLDGHEVKG